MSQQKTGDKRSRGKGNQAAGNASPGRGKQQAATPSTPTPTTEPIPALARIDDNLHQRFDVLDAELLDIRTFNENHQADMKLMINLIESYKKEREHDKRELQITKQELMATKECNRRLEYQVNTMANQMKECNIRIDGVEEGDRENLTQYIVELAADMGIENIEQGDIVSSYRLGKKYPGQGRNQTTDRPRTVMIVFKNVQVRNKIFFARAALKSMEGRKGVFINDDVTTLTRKMREDYRSVAALARSMGAEVRVHSDGIIIDGQKYLLTEPQTLPEQFSLANSKVIEVNGEIYFQSEHAYLSNFAPAPITEGDVVYMTGEHMYQAYKCRHMRDNDRLKQVIAATSPLEAKKIADAISETQDWKNIKDSVMEKVISAKFDQNEHLADLLVKTGSTPLNEATRNTHFGIGVGLHAKEIKDKNYHGANKLGHVLVAKRTNIKEKREAATDT